MNLPRIAQSPAVLAWSPAGSEDADRKSFGKLLLFTLFFLTIVLDFRRLEGDENPFVIILGIANVVLGAWYCAAHRYFTPRLFWWAGAFLLLVGVGTLTGILYGQEIYLVFAQAIPILSFLFAAIAVHSLSGDAEKRAAISIILATCFIATATKFIFGFYYYDLSLQTARYQIISGAVPLLFAYGLAGTLCRGRRFALTAILVAVVVVVPSVTRTYVIVFGLSALVCLYCYSKISSRLSGTLVIVSFGVILAFALTELFPGILGRWSDRFSSQENSVDLGAAYRLAEGEFQLRRLWSDFSGMVFGYGHGAKTGLAGDNVRLIAIELGRRATQYYSLGYGHNLYVGLLYVGGLVAGLPVIVAFLHLLWKGLRHARRSLSAVDQFLLIWGVSALAGYLVVGIFAGTFGDRSLSFFFGVSAGLVLLGLEPGRHVVNQVGGRGPETDGDVRTPKQRRARRAAQASSHAGDHPLPTPLSVREVSTVTSSSTPIVKSPR